MEVTEGNIRVGTEPTVTIGDTSIETCDRAIIKREVLALVKDLGTMRTALMELRKDYDHLTKEFQLLQMQLREGDDE